MDIGDVRLYVMYLGAGFSQMEEPPDDQFLTYVLNLDRLRIPNQPKLEKKNYLIQISYYSDIKKTEFEQKSLYFSGLKKFICTT